MTPDLDVAALRKALDFRASVQFEGGYHGSDLLRGVAAWMDKIDSERGTTNHEVQADLRRWADDIDRALAAAPTPAPTPDLEELLAQAIANLGYHGAGLIAAEYRRLVAESNDTRDDDAEAEFLRPIR